MLRKLTLGFIAAASLGLTALAPTSASAWGGHFHGGWHPGFGFHRVWAGPRFVGVPVYAGGNSCVVRRWVPTPFGPRLRLVNRCY